MNLYKFKLVFIVLIAIFIFQSNDYKAYQIYTHKGKKVDFEKLVKECSEADFVFFGELHNNPICHWLELELTKGLYENKKDKLIIGAEMFESDDQLKIDEYFSNFIKTRNFEAEARLWNNYQTDYKPVLEFAKQNKLQFVATNVPRRYASMVAKGGFSSLEKLNKQALKFLPPLPIDVDMKLACYEGMGKMKMSSKKKMPSKMGKKGMPNHIAEAQALKDACMAHFTLINWKEGSCFLHLNGTYHSDNHEGIIWFIKKKYPKAKIINIASVEAKDVDKYESKEKYLADFILVMPENMTKTY